MIEIQANDRLGKKIKLKCLETDTIGDVKNTWITNWYSAGKDYFEERIPSL